MMSVVGEDALDSEPLSNRTPEKGNSECPEKPGGPSPAEEDKKIALPIHGRRPRGRPRKTAALTLAATESGSSLPSPGDGDASTMTLDCHTRESDGGPQKVVKSEEVSEQPVKKTRGRRPLPPELRARKLLKTSEALSRERHPRIKVQLPPDGITASSADPLEVPRDQSGSSGRKGRNGVQVSAGPQNGQQKAKRTRELSKELRDEIVSRHTSGEGYKKIAKSLDIACSTVRGVVVKWKVHRTTDTLPRSGCPSKLSNETKSRLVAEVIVRPTVTLKELKSTIAEMGVIASETTIARSLHQAGLYYKVANKVETKESGSDVESNVNERPEQGNPECPVETSISSPKKQEKEVALPNHGKRPRGRPRKIAKEAQPEVASEGPVKKKRGRKPLPPELRAKKIRKSSSKASPRRVKPVVKKPPLPDGAAGVSQGGGGDALVSTDPPKGRQKGKKRRELPIELRDKIVQRHISGEGYKKISKSLDVATSTIRSVVIKWKLHRTTESLPRPGCPPKLSEQAKNRLVTEATLRPTVTLKELKNAVAEMGENVCESTIARSLRKSGLYYKIKRKVPIRVSQEGMSSGQQQPYNEVSWWEHYVREILSNRSKEEAQE